MQDMWLHIIHLRRLRLNGWWKPPHHCPGSLGHCMFLMEEGGGDAQHLYGGGSVYDGFVNCHPILFLSAVSSVCLSPGFPGAVLVGS